jgi:hypothetical protein
MGLSGKVDHCTRLMLLKQLLYQFGICNISVYKLVRFAIFYTAQVFRIARIGQGIEVKHPFIVVLQPLQNKIGTDETGATRYQKHLFSPAGV